MQRRTLLATNFGFGEQTTGKSQNDEPQLDAGTVVEIIDESADIEHIPGTGKLVGQGLTERDQDNIKSQASQAVAALVSKDVSSQDFRRTVETITNASQEAMLSMGQGSSRLMERSLKDMTSDKNSSQEVVATTLLELQEKIEDISGSKKGLAKTFGWLPGVKNVDKMVKRYASANETLHNIAKQLVNGKEQLLADNADLEAEKVKLREGAYSLFEHMKFTDQLKEDLDVEVRKMRASGTPHDIEKADIYESQVLFPIQQRRQDIRTQIAVAIQSYETIELIQKNNAQLALGVERAESTTMVALRNAVMISQAQAQQESVLKALEATANITNEMMKDNNKNLEKNTLAIHQQATQASVDPQVIVESLATIERTAISLRNFHKEANITIEKSVKNLDASMGRASQTIRAVEGPGAQQFSLEK